MSRARMREDQEFWAVVSDLRWKLDDGNGGFPRGEPEFSHGSPPRPFGVEGLRRWSTHLLAFALGALTLGAALLAAGL